MAEPTLNISKDLAKTLDSWAKITIAELRGSLLDKKISGTGSLYKSFTYKLSYDSTGAPKSVTIGFLYHGKFVDMGVGNGIKLENVRTNREVWLSKSREQRKGRKTRRPKKWYSPVMYKEYQRAAEILAKKYAIEVPARFEKLLSEKIEINL